MNCPICQQLCKEDENPGYYTHFTCYCKDTSPPDGVVTIPAFSAYIKSPRYPHSTYYYEFYFREPDALQMSFSYGRFSIWFYSKFEKIIVMHGENDLSPWTAYKLLKRYQNLKAFI